jgi:hypothetical protein
MAPHTLARLSDPILQRICGEFREMPGLRLTRKQAQRLWGLDEPTCTAALDLLVAAKFLFRTDDGAYARLTEGPVALPRLQMAKAPLDRSARDRLTNFRAS